MKYLIYLLSFVLILSSCNKKWDLTAGQTCYDCTYSIDYVDRNELDDSRTLDTHCLNGNNGTFSGMTGERYTYKVQNSQRWVYDNLKKDSALEIFTCIEN